MPDSILGVIFKGKDEVSNVVANVKKEIGSVSAAGSIAKGVIAGIFTAGVIGQLENFAKGAVNAVLALDAMREESEQISARFMAQAGSTQNAAQAMSAMNAIVGNAITNDEKMATSGQLMALGLADSATEAANLANIAINLGDKTQSTAARIEGLTQIMVSGRTVGLKNYGISMQDVNARAQELQDATAGLSDIEAKRQAIYEIGAQNLKDYAEAGGEAVTVTQNMAVAWANYQDAIANNVKLSGIKGEIAAFVNEATANLQMGATDPIDQLTGLENMLRILQERQAELAAKPIHLMANSNQAEIDALIERIAYLKQSVAESGDVGAGAMVKLAGGAKDATTAVDAVDKAIAALYAKQEAINVNAVAMAIFRAETDNTTASMLSLGAAMTGANLGFLAGGVFPGQGDTRPNYGAYDTGRKAGTNQRNAAIEAADIIREREKAEEAAQEKATTKLMQANKKAADDYRQKMEQAGQRMASRIEGYLTDAQNKSVGLLKMPGAGVETEPGKNGPFENMFRALDVANLGEKSPWAEKLGLTQDEAKKISTDFQAGIFSPEVMGLIDIDKLVDQVKMAELADKSRAAFVDFIAKKAGSSTEVVDALLGMRANEKGEKPSTKAAENAMNALADNVGTIAKGEDFAGKMIGYGETVWGYVESGMVTKAKGSGAFQAAIDAMVAGAIAGALA